MEKVFTHINTLFLVPHGQLRRPSYSACTLAGGHRRRENVIVDGVGTYPLPLELAAVLAFV